MEKLSIRKYRQDDYVDFGRLWELQMGETKAKKRALYFKWLIDGNPFSDTKDDYFVIDENDRVFAYNGLMPFKYSILGKDYDGYIYHDTLVDPAKRGQHLGSRLVKEIIEKTKLFSIAVWMNLPNARLYEKCGWKPVDKIFVYYRLYNAAPFIQTKNRLFNRISVKLINIILAIINKYKILVLDSSYRNLSITDVEQFDDSVDSLFHSVKSEFRYISYRTKEVLNWKYSNKEFSKCSKLTCTEDGELKGYMVYRKKEDDEHKKSKVTIFDFLCAPDRNDVFSALLKRVILDIEKDKVDYIEILCTTQVFKRDLKRLGFLKKKEMPFALKFIHSDYIEDSHHFSKADNWFLTYGDGDNLFWHFW